MKEGLDSPTTVVSIAGVSRPRPRSRPGRRRRIGALATLARDRRRTPALQQALPRAGRRGRRRRDAPDPQHGDARRQPLPAAALLVLPARGVRLPQEGRHRSASRCEGENRFHAIFDTDLLCCCVHPSATGTALSAYGAQPRRRLAEGQAHARRSTSSSTARRTTRRARTRSRRARSSSRGRPAGPRPDRARSTGSSRRRSPSTGRSSRPASCCRRSRAASIRNARVVFGSVAPTPYRSQGGGGGPRRREALAGDSRGGRPRRRSQRREAARRRTPTRSASRASSWSGRSGRPSPERRSSRSDAALREEEPRGGAPSRIRFSAATCGRRPGSLPTPSARAIRVSPPRPRSTGACAPCARPVRTETSSMPEECTDERICFEPAVGKGGGDSEGG